jgi:3-dehydroquinate synthase
MDPDTLNTLPEETFADGMAEVIKYGCIWDEAFFRFLQSCSNRQGVMEHIEQVLYTCCDIKAKVVAQDEHDTGLRMILNFGHTLGHAYEKAYHYETYTHGQAVAAGMCLAARLGETLGHTAPGTEGEIRALVSAYGLPVEIPCGKGDYESAIGLDKKGSGDAITVIFLSRLGESKPVKMDKKELLALL